MGISSSVPSEETDEAMNRKIDQRIDDKNEQIRAEVKTLEQTVLKLQKNATETQEKLRTELMTEIGIQIEKLRPNSANSDAVKTLEQQYISLSKDVSRDKAAVEKLGHDYDTLSRDVSQGKATVARLKSAVEAAMKQIATVRIQDAEHAEQLQDTKEKLGESAAEIEKAAEHQQTLEKQIHDVQHEVLQNEIKTAVNGEKINQSKKVGETNRKKIESIIEADKTLASTQALNRSRDKHQHQRPAVGGTNASPDLEPPDDPKAVTKAVKPSSDNKAPQGPKLDSMQNGAGIAGRLALSLLHAGLLQPVRNDVGTLGTSADLANPYLVRVV